MNKLKAGLAATIMVVAGGTGYSTKTKIIYNPDMGAVSALTAKSLNVRSAKKIPNIDGYVVEASRLNFFVQVPAGWVIQDEVEYHTQADVCLKTSVIPCPTDKPVDPVDPGKEPTDQVPWSVAQIHAPEAQRLVTGGGSTITVCLLDTGVDKNHPDLAGVIVGGMSMVGGDFQDDMGHGTHCAGIIAANANNSGIRGVSRAKIYAIKVLDASGSGSTSGIASGILEAPKHGCKIISMSLGSSQPDQLMQNAVNQVMSQGVIVVAAAGNSGGATGYPAAYQGVKSVSSTNQAKQLSAFSSRGKIEFAAPGENILSLKLGGGTTIMSGTSMACPAVAGAYALVLAKGRTVLMGDDIGLPATSQGAGLVNPLKSVQ